MLLLLFGMPGTGKSTIARSMSPSIEFDYGAQFLERSEELFGLKVANRVIQSHTQLLQLLPDKTVIASFPAYFNVEQIPQRVSVIFAIPEIYDMDEILNRLHRRKKHPYFATIDKATLIKWRCDWLDLYFQYCRVAEDNGFTVHRVTMYNTEDLDLYKKWQNCSENGGTEND